MTMIRAAGRRQLLAGTAATLVLATSPLGYAAEMDGYPPWTRDAGSPPQPVTPGPWQFFTPEEGAAAEALVDRLIPPDPQTPGGKDAGCAVFIDRQLAGPYGSSRGLYMRPPFFENAPAIFGPQSPLTPARRYRAGLAALDHHCTQAFAGKHFHELTAAQQDSLLADMQSGHLNLAPANSKALFEQIWMDTRQGFFADPIYGGNRDMVAWKMIGFPGARYDYRDWVDKYNQTYPRPPVGIGGRPAWTQAQK